MRSETRKFMTAFLIIGCRSYYFRIAMASISNPTSFGNRATSTQERAGK